MGKLFVQIIRVSELDNQYGFDGPLIKLSNQNKLSKLPVKNLLNNCRFDTHIF